MSGADACSLDCITQALTQALARIVEEPAPRCARVTAVAAVILPSASEASSEECLVCFYRTLALNPKVEAP
jgi:hypothetical protein